MLDANRTLVFAFLIIILTTPIALAESDEYGMINPRIFSQLTHGRSPHNEAHLSMIHAYEAWDLFEQVMSQPNGLSEVANVGIIDTQFYESHGDVRFAKTFANNDEATIRRQYEDSKNTGDSSPSHGTHVAGILGAIHQNNDGIDGMYPLANEPYLQFF